MPLCRRLSSAARVSDDPDCLPLLALGNQAIFIVHHRDAVRWSVLICSKLETGVCNIMTITLLYPLISKQVICWRRPSGSSFHDRSIKPTALSCRLAPPWQVWRAGAVLYRDRTGFTIHGVKVLRTNPGTADAIRQFVVWLKMPKPEDRRFVHCRQAVLNEDQHPGGCR